MMIKPQVMAQHVLRNQALAVSVLCALSPLSLPPLIAALSAPCLRSPLTMTHFGIRGRAH